MKPALPLHACMFAIARSFTPQQLPVHLLCAGHWSWYRNTEVGKIPANILGGEAKKLKWTNKYIILNSSNGNSKKKWIGMSGLERDRELLFCGKWLRGDIWSDREELAMHRSGRSLSGRWGSKNPRSEISCMPEEYIGGHCVWSRWRQGREAGEEEEREARQALLHPNLSSMAPCRPCSLASQVVPGSLQPHGLQCTMLPGPSPPPGACSNSGPLRRSFPVSPCGVQAVGLMPSDWVISRTEVLVYISKVVVDFRVFIHSVYLLGPSVMVTSMLRMIPGASVHGIL